MTMSNKGLSKLLEEIGELGQVAGKKLACMDTEIHFDGSNLHERMEEEMADVLASIEFVRKKFGLNKQRINERAIDKIATFMSWDKDPNV